MSLLKGELFFAGITQESQNSHLSVYSWILFDDEGNKLAEECGQSSYKTKEKVEYHALIQG